MSRTARIAAGAGGVLVAVALGVTAAAAVDTRDASGLSAGTSAAADASPAAASTRSGDSGAFAAWAADLGVKPATLRAALAEARADVTARQPRPTGIDQLQAALGAALARRLDRPEAQVAASLRSYLASRRAQTRDALGARLDAAVAAGRMTEADKAACLTAYDAGLLGRGGVGARMTHLVGSG